MSKNKTPSQCVKLFCKKDCCCGVQSMVKGCNGKLLFSEKICPLHFYRFGKGRVSVKIIRQHCLNFCMGGSRVAVRECPSTECSLYPFRMGKNPNYSEKTKKLKSRLAKKQGLAKIGLQSRVNKKVKVK
jgi:hypothetical protein